MDTPVETRSAGTEEDRNRLKGRQADRLLRSFRTRSYGGHSAVHVCDSLRQRKNDPRGDSEIIRTASLV